MCFTAADELEEFVHSRRSQGWKIKGIPATRKEGGGTSGGVMVAVRPRIGMGPPSHNKAWELVEGRLMVAHIDALCKGGVYMYCAYLWTSGGLSARNREILGTISKHAAEHGRPWVVGCLSNPSRHFEGIAYPALHERRDCCL